MPERAYIIYTRYMDYDAIGHHSAHLVVKASFYHITLLCNEIEKIDIYLDTPDAPVEPNPPSPLSEEFNSDSGTNTTKTGQSVG